MAPPSERNKAKHPRWSTTSMFVALASVGVSILAVALAVPRDAAHDDHFALALLALAAIQHAAVLLAVGGVLGVVLVGIGVIFNDERGLFPAAALLASATLAGVAIAALVRVTL